MSNVGSGKHTCDAIGCDQVIPSNKLMCPRHWSLVPADLQRRLYAAWRTVRNGTASFDRIRRYRWLRQECIDAVNLKLSSGTSG